MTNKTFKIALILAMLLMNLNVIAADRKGFVLWQLPSVIKSHMNSYVFQMADGKVVVMDGGSKGETVYLRGFLAALGNEIEAWFISHPHFDHMEALNEILKDPNGIKIKTIYHSRMSEAYYSRHEPEYKTLTEDFYNQLDHFKGAVVDLTEPGKVIRIDRTYFKVLGVKNEEININPYNNQSLVIKVWDNKKSIIFLGDLGKEGGDCLLNGPFSKDLTCDYLQMAHHGQAGVRKDFYKNIRFKACLWPTPLWLFNNDAGNGYNTHTWETIEISQLMKELGINRHYYAFNGLCKIE